MLQLPFFWVDLSNTICQCPFEKILSSCQVWPFMLSFECCIHFISMVNLCWFPYLQPIYICHYNIMCPIFPSGLNLQKAPPHHPSQHEPYNLTLTFLCPLICFYQIRRYSSSTCPVYVTRFNAGDMGSLGGSEYVSRASWAAHSVVQDTVLGYKWLKTESSKIKRVCLTPWYSITRETRALPGLALLSLSVQST